MAMPQWKYCAHTQSGACYQHFLWKPWIALYMATVKWHFRNIALRSSFSDFFLCFCACPLCQRFNQGDVILRWRANIFIKPNITIKMHPKKYTSKKCFNQPATLMLAITLALTSVAIFFQRVWPLRSQNFTGIHETIKLELFKIFTLAWVSRDDCF